MHALIMLDGGGQHHDVAERIGLVGVLFSVYQGSVSIDDLAIEAMIFVGFGIEPHLLVFKPVLFALFVKADGK